MLFFFLKNYYYCKGCCLPMLFFVRKIRWLCDSDTTPSCLPFARVGRRGSSFLQLFNLTLKFLLQCPMIAQISNNAEEGHQWFTEKPASQPTDPQTPSYKDPMIDSSSHDLGKAVFSHPRGGHWDKAEKNSILESPCYLCHLHR